MTIEQANPGVRPDSAPVREKGVFDISVLDSITKSNLTQRTALLGLIGTLISRSRQELALAQKHHLQGDMQQALKLLHTLRGAVGNLGAKQFAAESLVLEAAIRDGTPDVGVHVARVQVELEKTLACAHMWRQRAAPSL